MFLILPTARYTSQVFHYKNIITGKILGFRAALGFT